MSVESNRGFKAGINDVMMAWLPALVLFVLIPFAIYLPNQAEYNYNLKSVVPFLILAGMSFVLLLGVMLLDPDLRGNICAGLFYFGVFLALSDMLAPVPLGLLADDTQVDALTEPLRLTLIELAIAVAVVTLAVKIPLTFVRRIAPFMVLALALSELLVVGLSLSPRTSRLFFDMAPPPQPVVIGESSADKPNIYQIVFDGYSSCRFGDLAKEENAEKVFDGFTFFKEARTNYIHTRLSFRSYMTGTLFDGKNAALYEAAALESGLPEELYRAGYTISYYVPGLMYVHKRAANAKVTSVRAWINTNLYRLWLVRATPNILRREANAAARQMGTWLHSRSESAAKEAPANPPSSRESKGSERCCEQTLQLMEDEAERPAHGQYVYVHVNLPHPPYYWDKDCSFIGESDYNKNAQCATKVMAELIDRLKELGRYEESLIIIHSDHGWETEQCDSWDTSAGTVQAEIAAKIKDYTNGFVTTEEFFARTRVLLLIKPPNVPGKPLIVSPAPASLLDIPATVRDLIGMTPVPGPGHSVFAKDLPPDRAIHFFAGYKRAGKSGGQLVLGKHFSRAEFAHFSFSKGAGWKLHPDLPVSAGGGWWGH
ncbi:sulfatase-like hydrolase/transferase [Thermodesulfobacteriota bacterium]